MEEISKIGDIDWLYVFLAIVIALTAIKFIVTLGEWVISKFGLETKGMRKKREEHKLLMTTAKGLADLNKKHAEDTVQSIRHDEVIRKDLQNLTKMFIDKEIDDIRWEILNFASVLASSSRRYNKESFDHIIRQYEKYEQILQENNMENGQVTISMEIVMEIYKDKLKNGF